MKNCIFTILILFIASFVIISCGKDKNKPEEQLTYDEAVMNMMDMEPADAAWYYNVNRKKFSFMDSLFVEEIIPMLEDCSLQDIKDVFYKVVGTPVEEYVYCLYDDKKIEFLDGVETELDSLAEIEFFTFLDEFMPIVEVCLDSAVSEDVGKVMEEFAGGFLNINKLSFFGGETGKRFKEKWEECINYEVYDELLRTLTCDFAEEISNLHSAYYQTATGYQRSNSPMSVEVPSIEYNISQQVADQVGVYVSGELKGMLWSAFKDYVVPAALDAMTGGAYSTIYEVGNLAYDVKVTYDEIQSEDPTPEERLIYLCCNDLENHIDNTYIGILTENVANMLLQEKENLLLEIETALDIDYIDTNNNKK